MLDDGRVFAAVKRPVREGPVPFALRMMRTGLTMGCTIARLNSLRRGLRERWKSSGRNLYDGALFGISTT